MSVKLHISLGETYLDGWTNIVVGDGGEQADARCGVNELAQTCREMLAVGPLDGLIIRSVPALLSYVDALAMLKALIGYVQVGKPVAVVVPNMREVARKLAFRKEWLDSDADVTRFMRSAWADDLLHRVLESCGLEHIEIRAESEVRMAGAGVKALPKGDRPGLDVAIDEALALEAADQPAAARARLEADGVTRESGLRAMQAWDRIEAHTAHMGSKEAFGEFYSGPNEARVISDERLIPVAHRVHGRMGLIRHLVEEQGAQTVLELGCYDGLITLNLGTIGIRGVGVDLAQPMVDAANERAEKYVLPCKFVQGFIEDFDGDDKFDAVLLLETLEHVIDVDACLAVAEKHLAPGGRVYLSCPLTASAHPEDRDRERHEHVRLLGEDDFKRIITAPGRRSRGYWQFPAGDAMHHVAVYELGDPLPAEGPGLIVIPAVHRSIDLLEQTLQQAFPPDAEPVSTLVLADEFSRASIASLTEAKLTLDLSPVPRGEMLAANVALHRARTERAHWLLLLWTGVLLPPESRELLNFALRGHPEFGWVSAEVSVPTQEGLTRTGFTPWASMLTAAAVDALGDGFDLAFEGTDYGWMDVYMRLEKAGFTPRIVKGAQAVDQWPTNGRHRPWTFPGTAFGVAQEGMFRFKWNMDPLDWRGVVEYDLTND